MSEATNINFYTLDISPPCRAVEMLMRHIGLQFNKIIVDLLAGEQYKPDYLMVGLAYVNVIVVSVKLNISISFVTIFRLSFTIIITTLISSSSPSSFCILF